MSDIPNVPVMSANDAAAAFQRAVLGQGHANAQAEPGQAPTIPAGHGTFNVDQTQRGPLEGVAPSCAAAPLARAIDVWTIGAQEVDAGGATGGAETGEEALHLVLVLLAPPDELPGFVNHDEEMA